MSRKGGMPIFAGPTLSDPLCQCCRDFNKINGMYHSQEKWKTFAISASKLTNSLDEMI